MIHCTSCGQELPDNASFCSQCGAATSSGQPAASGTGAPPGATPPAGDKPVTLVPPASPVARVDPAAKVWLGWPSRKRHIPMLSLWLVLMVAGLIGLTATPWLGILAAIGGLGTLWTLGRMLLEPLMLRYWLTIDRLFIRRGLLWITTDQTELIRLEDIRVRQGLLERLLGIGNVEVVASSDATDGNIMLLGVADPDRVAELVRTGMQTVRSRRGLYVENV